MEKGNLTGKTLEILIQTEPLILEEIANDVQVEESLLEIFAEERKPCCFNCHQKGARH